MAAKRKPAAKTTAAKNRKSAPQPPAAHTKRAWSVLLFLFGGLFIIFCLIPADAQGVWVQRNIIFGVFGISGWLAGPLMIYLGFLMYKEKLVLSVALKGFFVMAALTGLVLAAANLDFTGNGFGDVLQKVFLHGAASRVGGGVVSILLGALLQIMLGRVLAIVVLVLLLIISVMWFANLTPGDIVRYFRKLSEKMPQQLGRVYDDEELEEYEEYDYYDETPDIEQKRTSFDHTRQPRNRKQMLDIPLPEEDTISTPGLGQQEEVEIPTGGTFGKKPLDEMVAPQANAQDISAVVEEDLLFGADDPLALPRRSGLEPRGEVYDYEAEDDMQPAPLPPARAVTSQEAGGEAAQQFDLFAQHRGEFVAVAQDADDFEKTDMTFASVPGDVQMAGEAPPLQDASLERLLERADAKRDNEPATPRIQRNEPATVYTYQKPPMRLFGPVPIEDTGSAKEEMRKTAELLVSTLESFGVQTRILDVSRGPSVTRYEIQPQAGVKISRITNLADDIALNLAAAGVRIEAPIPGKPAVGIEVPNQKKSTVSIRSVLESAAFADNTSPLPIALGKDIAGDCVVTDLTKMPHLLIAGSTGSGKSVCVNATIMSFLYHSTPDEMRMVLIDPKVVELAEYNGIPHLLMPVVTEPRKAAAALGAMVAEMERRYRLFAENNVRDIRTFNKLAGRRVELDTLPHIAIIIDELADLMMTSGKEVEDYICRIAQKARAAGMHLVVATQRPSVDVITGLIKANIPSRIAFAVSSQVDSRTILDGAGAEKLLGMGDMLFMPVGANKPVRIQGTYVQDKDISNVLEFIKRNSETQYDESLIADMEKLAAPDGAGDGDEDGDLLRDEMFINAVEMALESGGISTSLLQRRLRLGYARAGRIVDEMERMHIIGGPNGSKPREVLISRQQWLEMSMNAESR